MERKSIKSILSMESSGIDVLVRGWVRTKRESKGFSFLEINDGSTHRNIQVIADSGLENYNDVTALSTGSSISVTGKLVDSPAKGQSFEVKADEIVIFGGADPATYPLQKKGHSIEFLREISHLRPRTNTFGAVFRLRSSLSYAIHTFFTDRGFYYVHTPVITTSDCEGAGEMFKVTTFDLKNVPLVKGEVDFSKDFFGVKTGLTVSGQLEGELLAMALGKIYTFGPTFRAENSNTSRHLSEFWMIEPEVAFAGLSDNIALAEEFIKYLFRHCIEKCGDEMDFFNSRVQPGIIENLGMIVNSKFEVVEYSEAVQILEKSGEKFEYPSSWGLDLQSEHERYLTEKHFGRPIFIINYPKAIKSFYMKQNDDGKTVRAMDLLVPGIGEIIGGSEREDNLDSITARMIEGGLNPEDYWWYLDIRKYGSAPHAGFGLGFERLIQYVTGMQNIRDVIPFPRTPKKAGF